MHPQGNGPDARMWLSAASLSAAAVRQMTTEVSERALDLDLAAQQLQVSISAAISALGAEEG